MSEARAVSDTELQLRLEKLRLEIQEMKRSQAWNRRLGQLLPVISSLLPVMALLFAVQQFNQQQKMATAALNRQTDADSLAMERAFMQPVLERQMDTYFEASAAAATYGSTDNPEEKRKARDAFWRLYWGPLVMLESPEVSQAMKHFGACLNGFELCSPKELQDRSLVLSSSLQSDLFGSWKLSPMAYAERSIKYVQGRRSGR